MATSEWFACMLKQSQIAPSGSLMIVDWRDAADCL